MTNGLPRMPCMIKKLYDAYVNAGFTNEQSYGLLVRDKIVRAENMKKSMTNKKTSTEKGK